MAKVSLYLNFPGNTEEAFNFYKSVFKGDLGPIQRFKDGGMNNAPTADLNKIMHISLPIGENLTIHGTDTIESMGQKLVVGNNAHIMLEVKSKEEADRFYQALSAGGKDQMPMQDTFWGAYFGSFTDRFGVQWMIDFEKNPQ
jgi:PhnB protein